MAYVKNTWVDQKVERPKTYEMINNPDGSVTLVDSFGNVEELGTPVNADNMNHIEDGIAEHEDRITLLEEGADTSDYVQKSGDTMTGTLNLADTDITGSGQLRITKNSGVIFRNDGENFYILLTDKDNPDGDYNDLRPFTINLEQGYVTTRHPNYTDGDTKVATAHFVKYILANSGFGLADIDKNSEGYIDFAVGFKVRWGQITFASGSHTADVNFKKPFNTTAPKVVLFRKSAADTTVTDAEVWCRGTSTTGFNLYQTSTQPYGYMWIAIGY